jgi:RNA polymerase sigma-70 factor (ECF subfamily)
MANDMAALAELFQQYHDRLRRMLERRMPSSLAPRLDPEDVLQEAFHRACSKYARFRSQTALAAYPWLYGIVRDCYLKQWHRHTRHCRNHLQDAPWPEGSSLQLGLGLMAAGSTPSEAVANEELRQRVLRAMQRLSDEEREILAMRYWEDFSFAEIGAVLALATETARLRHAQALLAFQFWWQQFDPRKEPAR